MSELSPEQQKALRDLATQRVNRKMKSTEERLKKEKKWAAEQISESSPTIKKVDSDKVAVKIDARTIVMVRRDKCRQLKDGTWVKKDDKRKHE